jgi:hypothetical protein
MMITLGKGPIYAKCSKQKLVSKSSEEAELVALSDETSRVVWCRNFLLQQGYQMPPALIYQDNMSAMAMIKRGRGTSALSKHINHRYFWVRDFVEDGQLHIQYLRTDNMICDMLTKPLQGDKFRQLRA